MPEAPSRQEGFRRLIEDFIANRFAEKLKKNSTTWSEDKKRSEAANHSPPLWLQNTAKLAKHITLATHITKGTHTSAEGTDVQYCSAAGNILAEVGCHALPENELLSDAGTNNAANLIAFSFLSLKYEEETLLHWLKTDDPDLLAVLEAPATAKQLQKDFLEILRKNEEISSHELAKQLYWLIGDDPGDDSQYRLLAPLYASSFAHVVFSKMQKDKEGREIAGAAREAKKAGKYSEHPIHYYFNMAFQKLGGENAQNVSIFNARRGGQNYLLASLPPQWNRTGQQPLRGSTSTFVRFGKQRDVAALVTALSAFLQSDPPAILSTRKKRDGFIEQIVGEFILYADRLLQLPPGWTTDPTCRIPSSEKLFLDPGRAATDADFAQNRAHSSWMHEIAESFGKWLNNQLEGKIPVGDAEVLFWSKEFKALIRCENWEKTNV